MPSGRSIYIVGPTASGKSAVALSLAEELGGEIISVDSMQVYRGLDIGTAKPTREERVRIPHHLIDVVELSEPFDAAKFCERARRTENEITARVRVPIYCGGTGLYLKALLEGLGNAPPSDPELRKRLESTPLEQLLAELAVKDPATHERIDRNNPRRVVRAMEVIGLTGQPFSAQRSQWNSPTGEPPPRIFGLQRETEDLRGRINVRGDEMFARGLVEETRSLLAHGLDKNQTAMQALGYRQVIEHLRGEHSLAETIELVKIKTRQYAKRQMTWFRRQLPVQWIEVKPGATVEAISEQISSNLSR